MKNAKPIERYLDHAVLKPDMTTEEAKREIQKGIDLKVRTVCVRPCDIILANEMCKGTETEVCTVLGFPHGCGLTVCKVSEAKAYIELGVKEIDMVANYGWICSEKWDDVRDDIKAVASVCNASGIILKVIFETACLTTQQITKATELCIDAGADFVKTSTGFNGSGAKIEDVKAMIDTSAGRIKVKPSGGIRDYNSAKIFIDMGADRLGVGSSSSPVICSGQISNQVSTGY